MGIIFIVIGVLILRAVYKASLNPSDSDFKFENVEKYSWLIMNPSLKLILVLCGWGLTIFGIISFFL